MAVVGVAHTVLGEEVKAVVQLRPGATVTGDELREFCKQRLRRYEYPHVVRFVDELPRTLTGKVQRFALREAIGRTPTPTTASVSTARAEAPRTL